MQLHQIIFFFVINTYFSQEINTVLLQRKYINFFPFFISSKKHPQGGMLQQEQSKDHPQPVKINKPQEKYPGICNLCALKQHLTIDCPFSTLLYHSTNLQNLMSIVENGFNPRKGRLGKAIYCSDDPLMCVRFVLKNREKFPNPVLVKIKVMLTDIKTLNNEYEVQQMTKQELGYKVKLITKQERIECIKCPYFKVGQQILYQFALFDVDYSIIGWSRIKLPQQQGNIEKQKTTQISIPVSAKGQNNMMSEDCKTQTSKCSNYYHQRVQQKVLTYQMVPEIEEQLVSRQKSTRISVAQRREQEQQENSSKMNKTKFIGKPEKYPNNSKKSIQSRG